MKHKTSTLIIWLIFFFPLHVLGQENNLHEKYLNEEFTTLIKGKIIGNKVDSLFLFKATEDTRGKPVVIKVENGRFEYELISDTKQAYYIVYPYQLRRGYWRIIEFFSEPDTIHFRLYPENAKQNHIYGGKLMQMSSSYENKIDSKFWYKDDRIDRKIDSLKEVNKYFTEAYLAIQRKIKAASNAEEKKRLTDKLNQLKSNKTAKTDLAKKYEAKEDSLIIAYYSYRTQYVRDHTSPFSYYLLYQMVRQFNSPYGTLANFDVKTLKKLYRQHAKKFPAHPYTYVIRQSLNGITSIRVGEEFVNFTIPTIEGSKYTLSELIDGKIAVLDLWASWCGPCIEKSQKLVPIYKKYKDDGFTVVGIAREFENTKRLKKALERLEFPWINLVELNDKHYIWRKYGIPYSGGGLFLISSEGKILAVTPTVKEISNILKQRL